jgi:protease-4
MTDALDDVVKPVADQVVRAANRAISEVRNARRARTAPLVLELDLTERLLDPPPTDPLGQLLALRRHTVRGVVDGLRKAAGDPRVRVLLAKIGELGLSMAAVQEIRDAVAEFRRAGKRTIAWAESFGEFGPGTVPYYLATAFGEIWLQPTGDVGLTGLSLEATFVRGTLDKLGVEVQIGARYEYKNAPNQLTETAFTPAHREAATRLTESMFEQVVSGIAEGRKLTGEAVRRLADDAPLTGEEALAAGLVDTLGYRDEVYAAARVAAGDGTGTDAELRFLARYVAGPRPSLPALPKPGVAVIPVIGTILRGRSGRSRLGGAPTAGSDSVTSALRSAVRSAASGGPARSVVLRVDSPGGSYIASDAIWREVRLARRAGMPVVVSMGGLAASGGYFVSAPADCIVAQPGTLTGSIGVFGGKQNVSGLLDKAGVSTDAVHQGRNARMFSARTGFSREERERLEGWLDRVYDDFAGKVAEGRAMTRAAVHEVARGRVWTGADAVERGLVDVLGGLDIALDEARRRAGLVDDAPVINWPRLSPVQRLRPPRSSDDPAAALGEAGGLVGRAATAGLAGHLLGWGQFAEIAAALELPAAGPLTVPWTVRLR